MGRAKQPIAVVLNRGKKHLTKAEIERRSAEEVKAANDNITAPKYLTAVEKRQFIDIAEELKELDIISNLDCDILGRYIRANTQYTSISKQLKKIDSEADIKAFSNLCYLQISYIKVCNECAKELGLTISSRCKLVVPKKQEEKPVNKFLREA